MDKKFTRPLVKFAQLQNYKFLEQREMKGRLSLSLDTLRSPAGRVWSKTRISTMVLT